MASKDFNQGLRAYYFGLAVLYWREFHSQALRTLELPAKDGSPPSKLWP